MNYSVSLLTTRPDCQSMIDFATRERSTQAYRKQGLELQRSNATVTSQEIESNLLAVTAELEALQTVHAALPDGPSKDAIFNSIKKCEFKKFQLEQRKENYGTISLLEKEYDIASIDRAIVETDDFIAQLTARFNQLP